MTAKSSARKDKKTTTKPKTKATSSKTKPAAKKRSGAGTKATAASRKSGTKATAASRKSGSKATAASRKSGTKVTAASRKPAKTAKKTEAASAKTAPGKGKTDARKGLLKKQSQGKKKASAKNLSFSLDEALEIASREKKEARPTAGADSNGSSSRKTARQGAGKRKVTDKAAKENRVHGAASISDILGYNPDGGEKPASDAESIPTKFRRYYKLLVELRDHVLTELDLHTQDTLKRSSKDDTGNLSSYSQHMADAGTDTFDRDFALSLVSTEQEALYEIEEAIQRIKAGTYGICEITGKPIKRERLLAVPFARFSVEGQAEYERTHKKSAQRGGAFAESGEESVQFLEDDVDE